MPVNPADSPVFSTLFGTDAMRAVFDDRTFFQRMLDVEAALARVEAHLGIIPHQAAGKIYAAASLHARAIAEGMTIDVERMRRNLDATQGLVAAEAVMMALAEEIGRGVAHDPVHKASDRALAERRPLAEILAEDPAVTRHLDAAALARLTDPAQYLGEARDVVDRVLKRACRVVPERKEVSP